MKGVSFPSAPHPAAALPDHTLAWLSRYGDHAVSFQAVSHGKQFRTAMVEGFVPYVTAGQAWIAPGAPIAAYENRPSYAKLFADEARRQRRRAFFFAAEQSFADQLDWNQVCIGKQPYWNPQTWSSSLECHAGLRRQIKRAANHRLRSSRLRPGDLSDRAPLRFAIERLIQQTCARRPMPPMEFLVSISLFSYLDERRFYAAFQDDNILAGFLCAVPIYVRSGWLFVHVLRDTSAPNGTTEFLLDAAMKDLAQKGCEYVTLGLTPLCDVTVPWLKWARRLGSGLYNFDGLAAFRQRLAPTGAESVYVLFPSNCHLTRIIGDSLIAFTANRPVRFAILTILRGSTPVVGLLVLMLIPWTVLLALADTQRWFPSPEWKWFWVTFDVVLCILLGSLARRFKPNLARLCACIVSFDAVATAAEILVFNVQHSSRWIDWVAITLAFLAPSVAAIILWARVGRWRRETAQPYLIK